MTVVEVRLGRAVEAAMTADARVRVTPALAEHRAALENLAQLYCHDWSELVPIDVGADGRFDALALARYWEDDELHPFLVHVGDALAGFVLVAGRSRLTGDAGVFDMTEFFIMRKYRRQGVGLAAALAVFERFKAPWELRQRDENPAATAFWRRAASAYTNGNYREARCESAAWTGAVQSFMG